MSEFIAVFTSTALASFLISLHVPNSQFPHNYSYSTYSAQNRSIKSSSHEGVPRPVPF